MAYQEEEITLHIAGTSITVRRQGSLAVPFELTIVIPRAEIRNWHYQNGKLCDASEIILNSITVSDAPRRLSRPVAGPPPAPPSQRTTWKYVLPAGNRLGFGNRTI